MRHENIRLASDRLRAEKVIKDVYLDTLIEAQMCCKQVTEACLFRKCAACSGKAIEYSDFNGNVNSHYEIWERKTKKGRDNVEYKRTVKHRVPCKMHELVDHFSNLLLPYMAHLARIRHQFKAIRDLKANLSEKEFLINIEIMCVSISGKCKPYISVAIGCRLLCTLASFIVTRKIHSRSAHHRRTSSMILFQ